MTRANSWMTMVLAVAVTAALPVVARAQEPRASIAGGYTFLQQRTTSELGVPTYPFGWIATGSHRIGGGRWAAVGEFGISYQTNDFDERRLLIGVLGGARVALYRSGRLAIFAQALAGVERFSEPGLVESGIAVQPGGGLDVYLSSKVFVRAEGDYRWSQPNDTTFHAYRLVAAVGVAIR